MAIGLKSKDMPDKERVTSNRDKFAERMKGKYPDKDFADDEALWGQVNEDYDGYDRELAGYKEREKTFSDLFTSDPRSAAFLTNWRNGGNPVVELVRMFGEDFVEEMKDPAKQEELSKASQDFAERVAKEKEFDELYKKNISETRATVEAMQREDGLSDEEIDKAMEFLVGIMKDGVLGKFSPESIQDRRKTASEPAWRRHGQPRRQKRRRRQGKGHARPWRAEPLRRRRADHLGARRREAQACELRRRR